MILDRLLGGRGTLAAGVIPPALDGADTTRQPYAHDVTRAKQLLAEAGHPKGIDVQLWCSQSDPFPRIAQTIQAYLARAGIRVTIVQRDARLIPREDPDVSEAVRKILEQDGLTIDTEAAVARIERDDRGRITVHYQCEDCERSAVGSHLLLAIGRQPNVEALNLAAAGIAQDKGGFIHADNTLKTSVEGVYALGDVKGGPAFTHISYDDYRLLRDRWLHGMDTRTDGRLVPNTMYIDPQLAQVGLTETEARKKGLDIRVARLPMTGVARALETDEDRGFMKVIVDAKTEAILGCTVLGMEGGEIMSMLQIAMMGKLPYPILKEAIFAHPTLAEGLNNIFLALDAPKG